MIKVTAEKGKFIVRCPFHLNGAIRELPGKRWSSSKKAFVVPFSRKAAELLSHVPENIEFDAPAVELMATASRPKKQKAEFPVWYSFKTKPMPHQIRALNFAWGKEAIAFFMAMRTGKTKTNIDLACAMRMEGMIDAMVVFCPLSVRKTAWEAQIHEHAPIDVLVGRFDFTKTSGKNEFKKFLTQQHDFKVLIVGVESMSAGSAYDYAYDFVAAHENVFCVVDESHLIKTHNSARTDRITQIGSVCAYRSILTGTPTTSSPLDLFAQFRFLDPDIVGYSDFYSFKARYAVMGGYENKQIVGYQNLDELMRDISPHTFQVNAEEVADLPPKIYSVREVELTETARRLYNQIKKHKLVEHGGRELIMATALEKLTRLSMLVNGVMAIGESGKYEYDWVGSSKITELMNLVEENPAPTVIWANGKLEIKHIIEALHHAGHKCAELHGGVHESDRPRMIDMFQNGEVNYMVASPAVGGTGTKLSRARMLVYMSNSFKFVDRKQSEERATDFMNPGESVLIVDIVAVNTVDDLIIQPALQAKQDVAKFVNSEIGKLKMEEV